MYYILYYMLCVILDHTYNIVHGTCILVLGNTLCLTCIKHACKYMVNAILCTILYYILCVVSNINLSLLPTYYIITWYYANAYLEHVRVLTTAINVLLLNYSVVNSVVSILLPSYIHVLLINTTSLYLLYSSIHY